VSSLGFSDSVRKIGLVGSDVISPGDTLGLTIWENVDDALFAGQGTNFTSLEEVQVDVAGFIFVPYAGRIKASGNSPQAIRKIITDRLKDQTPDPQVQVRRLAGDGATVTLIGAVGSSGVYPIERPTRTLSTMLANAGGVAIEPEVAQISLLRGKNVKLFGSRIYISILKWILHCATATAFWWKPMHVRLPSWGPQGHKRA
jgi:polysaccharide export outer membrane protein